MRIITYADSYKQYEDDNRYKAVAFKALEDILEIEPINGPGGKFELYHKIIAVDSYIQHLPDDELIVFLDAFDVLPVNNVNKNRLEYAIEKTYNLEKITFNAEVGCYPSYDMAKYFDHIPGEWKYLNSGMYVGKVKKLKPYLCNIIEVYIKTLKPNRSYSVEYAKWNYNDQTYCMKEYIKDNSMIDLDYNCNIFQTLYAGKGFFAPPHHKLYIDYEKKIIKNTSTNTYPLLVHGNGKVVLDSILPIISRP